MTQLSQGQVRAAMIAAQDLNQPNRPPTTKADVLATIRRMQVLQIDTINVVARSPYLVLWSRLGDYDPRWLDELLAEGNLFEYWSHAACFLPIEDYPLYRRLMLENHHAEEESHSQKWLREHESLSQAVLKRIQALGAVKSSDFERTDGKAGGWWEWKDEKVALECLFNVGELMVQKRHHFQRFYDLRERIVIDWDDTRAPSLDEVRRAFVTNTVKALGVTNAAWVADYFRMYKATALAALKWLVDHEQLYTVKVDGWDVPGYVHPDNTGLIELAAGNQLPKSTTTLLSPFDPLVWHRARAQELFKFDYKIECYTPEAKRTYGYFTLPILYNNALIGRLDPKAHRKDGLFEIKALHLEPDVEITDELVQELQVAIQRCADWHQTPQVVVRKSDPPELCDLLKF